jgi:ABC-type branched-subunit amino acid transport system ATPase component
VGVDQGATAVDPAEPVLDTAVEPVLDASAVSVHFGGIRALNEVDLVVPKQSIVVVIGPNGAGKTTLLNALTGVVPMTGTVRCKGIEVSPVSGRNMAKIGVARSFQHPQLVERASVIENVLCGAHVRWRMNPIDQIFRRRRLRRLERSAIGAATALLRRAAIDAADWGRPVSELPHGERKRIDIVRALMREPDLLIMDEPTSGMGEAEREIVAGLIAAIRDDDGASVLVVEHHMDVVRRVADTVMVLEVGRVARLGPASDVLAAEATAAEAATAGTNAANGEARA